jgi:penicillin-binding protein 2
VPPGRLRVLQGLTVAVGLVLVGRLYEIQFARGEELRTQADANRFVAREIEADRGVIYDAAGQKVVLNRPRFTVSVVTAALPEGASASGAVLARLATLLGIPLQEGAASPAAALDVPDASAEERAATLQAEARTLHEMLPYSGATLIRTWQPIPIARNVSRDAAFRLMEAAWSMPGVIVGEAPVREYPAGPTMAHLLGFTSAIPPDELDTYLADGYAIYDVVGRSGLEATYESWLRGRKGEKIAEVDATGRELRVAGQAREPVPGASLRLTVDLEFQRAVEDAHSRQVWGGRGDGPSRRGSPRAGVPPYLRQQHVLRRGHAR